MLIKSDLGSTRTHSGVGLIEVLVAVLVLTIGILGLVGLQTRSLQLSHASLQSSQALLIAYEMTDRIRANKDSADSYAVNYGTSVTASANCSSASCSPEDIASYDLSEWKTSLAANLPNGDGQIERDTSGARPFFTISVKYVDSKLDKALAGGTGTDSTREVVIRTEM